MNLDEDDIRVQFFCRFEIFPNKSWVKKRALTLARYWKYPKIQESQKGQETRIIWMPNTLCFLKAVIAILFSISKNFLNSSTTINSTRVPKRQDCFHIPGKIFLGTKIKKDHENPKTQKQIPPAPLEEKDDRSFWWLSDDSPSGSKQDPGSLVSPKVNSETRNVAHSRKDPPFSNCRPWQTNRGKHSLLFSKFFL